MSAGAVLAAAAISAFVAPAVYRDYEAFMLLGPGGLPHNIIGWAISNLLMKPIAHRGGDTRSIRAYMDSREPSYLPSEFPPRRHGERPTFGKHPVPHRQLDQIPPVEVRRRLVQRVEELSRRVLKSGAVDVAESKMEGRTEALFVAQQAADAHGEPSLSAAAAAVDTRGEFAHVRATGDHSLHVILSPPDCVKVIEAQLGERHAFDGSKFARYILRRPFPETYILIYAPRSEEEIDLVVQLVEASISYMTGVNLPRSPS